MSQNNPTRNKYNTYNTNQPRGHSDFGQAGYSQQQYAYQTALQSVSANPAHDMSKQVSAGQPGMYQSSGGMPTGSQHHHQPTMTGPAPSPQPSPIVNPSQQLSRHVAIPNYYTTTRNSVPRTVPNMGRNNMSTVVNQAAQQQAAASQYSHMQLVTSHPMHPAVTPLIVNTPLPAPMYQHGRYPAAYPGTLMNTPPQLYSPFNPNNFNYTPHGAANGYYPHHQISYAMNSQQVNSTQASAPVAQPTKKRLAIIDPSTGKDILQEGLNEETPPTKEETAHNDAIGLQFATQVAQTLGTEKKSEPLETSSVETNSRIVQSTVICSTPEVEIVSNTDITDDPNINENETFDDQESITYYNKEQDISNVVDSYENKSSIEESSTLDLQNVILNNETVTVTSSKEIDNYVIETNQTDKSYYDIQEPPEVPIMKSASPDRTDEEKPAVTIEENLPAVDSDLTNTNIKTEKNEAKKKTKKKKDFNKKGESKEGGEMDAFLDKTEEQPASQVTTQVPVTSSSNTIMQTVAETNNASSPVPIVDSEILNEIPLPGEVANTPKTEDSDKESPPEDSPAIPTTENDIEDKENILEENNTQNKIVLKYTYKEDQWSPLNPEGKKQYDRDFLLQLQSQPMSLCKPSNLPNLDVIKDKAHIQRLTEVNRTAPMPMPPVRPFDPFMPQYARGGNPLRPPHPANIRRSQQGRGDKKPKIITLTTNQNIKLHESENAWKPTHKAEKITDEDAEEEELFRKIRGILNKLTPQKFQTLVEQVKELPIDTMKKLEGTINLIFEKAIDEPNFSVPYANMCKQLALIKVPLNDGQGVVNFRKLLLTKCQKEFEQDKSSEKKREDKIKAMKAAKDDEEKFKELQLELEEEEKKMRWRQLGNIRFIGELFKLNMLIEPIMHECIKKLLAQGDEESLECLCRLLKTIGKELDEKGGKSRENNLMDSYFVAMQRIVDKRLTSSRVRFMLQDVIDLKKNNWIPRRDENNPKTIDQIHKEAEKEAREAQQAYQNINYSKRLPDDRRKISGRSSVAEDGWTPTSKSNKGSYSVVDPSKLKLTKPDEVESIRLGPGGKGLQSWGKGSSGGNRASVDPDMKTALTNRYSALADQGMTPSFENRRGSQRSAASSRESSRGRNSQLPPTVRKTPSTSRERESLIETVKELNRNAVPEPKLLDAKKVESHVNGKMTESVSALALNGPDLSEEDIEKKTKPLIDEFLHNADFEEAEKCVMELASPSTVHYLIYYAINQVLERSSQTRYLLGQLLCSLVKKNIVTLEEYKKGLSGVLENIDDYAVDIPKIWEYMGDILEPMVEDKLPLLFLKDVLEPCIPSETAGKLISAVLHCAAKKKGTIKLGELWRESGLQWSDFLGNSVNINEFISNHKLEFTVSQTKVIPNTEISIEEIRTKLRELLENNEDNESIFDYIDAKVPPSAVSEPAFIRALAQEVHKAAITGTGTKCELDQATLKKRIPLLTKYIDHNENLELQALYAVQHLMTDLNQPKGVLRQIFDILYDDDVITEETFKVWENSDDPAELEGKGVALNCVRGFFTWLREAEESGEEVEDE